MADALVSYTPVLAFLIPLRHTQMLKEPICLSMFIQLNTQQDHFLVMFLVLGLISLHSVRYSSQRNIWISKRNVILKFQFTYMGELN